MTLYVLRRNDMDHPAYDVHNGFVIRAANRTEARLMASEHAGDEGPEVWTDLGQSTCDELSNKGKPVIVMADFNAG